MFQQRVYQNAVQKMKAGNNCCQAVIMAACQEWGLPVPEDLLSAASLFGEGMQAGCTCGALSGMIMASGLRSRYQVHPRQDKLALSLHDIFKQNFGSTCCRVIKKKRSIIDRVGSRACQELTGKAAVLLIEQWKELDDDPSARVVGNNTNP